MQILGMNERVLDAFIYAVKANAERIADRIADDGLDDQGAARAVVCSTLASLVSAAGGSQHVIDVIEQHGFRVSYAGGRIVCEWPEAPI
jgi:hypothetical protein